MNKIDIKTFEQHCHAIKTFVPPLALEELVHIPYIG